MLAGQVGLHACAALSGRDVEVERKAAIFCWLPFLVSQWDLWNFRTANIGMSLVCFLI